MNHQKMRVKASACAFLLGAALGGTLRAADAPGKPVNLSGYVLDSACAYVKDLKKPISAECAVTCAKAGSPLVILTREGAVYLPISEAPPATGQNDRLMEYAGKMVTVTGKAYVKGGSHAIVIEKIEASRGVLNAPPDGVGPRARGRTKLWNRCICATSRSAKAKVNTLA